MAEPLQADRRDRVDVLHGVSVDDPYQWLEDGSDPAVVAWDARCEAEFVATVDALPETARLVERLRPLVKYDDSTVRYPCLRGDRSLFYTKRAEQDKWVLWVADGPDDPGRILVDPNTWGPHDALVGATPSPDGRYLVLSRAHGGNEDPALIVLEVDTGRTLPDTLRGWKRGSPSWAADGSGFWYAGKPVAGERGEGEQFYWHRVWWHTLGTDAAQDELVLADETDRELHHTVWVSDDGRWQFRVRGGFHIVKLWLCDLADPARPVVALTEMDASYSPIAIGDRLYVCTDWGAPRSRVMVGALGGGAAGWPRDRWTELVPEQADVLDRMTAIGDRLYLQYRHDTASRIEVRTLDGALEREIPLPTAGSASVSGQLGRPEVRVNFSSFAHPPTVYRYDPPSGALTVEKEPGTPVSRALLADVVVDRVRVRSRDGTEVPMSVIHRRGIRGQAAPTLLTGYGGFNIGRFPEFSATYLLWVESGGRVVIPNLRGGGEFGRDWHRDGALDRKQNVFDDFVAAAEWLYGQGLAAPGAIAAAGGSNGGLLVAAAMTQRPDLFGAIACTAPLTDMVRYEALGIGAIWAEEYGSVDHPDEFRVLYAYSPYHRVVEGTAYPPLLVTGSLNDARTDPAHARKFHARIRWGDRDRGAVRPILLSMQADSGHHGAVAVEARIHQLARQHAFLMHHVGLVP